MKTITLKLVIDDADERMAEKDIEEVMQNLPYATLYQWSVDKANHSESYERRREFKER